MPVGFFSVGYIINRTTVWGVLPKPKRRRSERITECQMEAERISERGSIKVPSAIGRIREMQCITDVEAKDEHVHVPVAMSLRKCFHLS